MEKRSRVNKYRELRESIKEDATLPEQNIEVFNEENDDTSIPTLREYRMKQIIEEVKELDNDKENELDGVKKELESKEIEEAISRVRMTAGKGQQYNTRLEILNHLQSGTLKNVDQVEMVSPSFEEEPLVVEEVESIKTESRIETTATPASHFKIFFDDEKEDKIESEKTEIKKEPTIVSEPKRNAPVHFEDEEDTFVEEMVQKRNFFNQKEDDIEEEYEEDNEDSGIMVKLLTGLIVVLSVCLIGLLGYIVKLFFF